MLDPKSLLRESVQDFLAELLLENVSTGKSPSV